MIELRRAAAIDARLLAQTRQIVWKETYRGIYPDAMMDDYDLECYTNRDAGRIADSNHHFYLFMEGAECVGYFSYGPCNFGPYKDFDLCLNNLYVRREFKGRGLGKLAFAHIRAYCWEQGIPKFFCGCNYHNTSAMGFYAYMGGVLGDEVSFHESKADDIVHYEFAVE